MRRGERERKGLLKRLLSVLGVLLFLVFLFYFYLMLTR